MIAEPHRALWLLSAIALSLGGSILVGCGGPRSRMLSEADADGQVADALAALADLPRWSRTESCRAEDRFTADDVQHYVDTARTLSRLEPDSTREAYRIYLGWAETEGFVEGRRFTHDLYILNRILFAVPRRVAHDDARYFVVLARRLTLRPPPPPPYADMLRPVSLGPSGAITDIRSACDQPTLAGPYAAIDAFDHLHATYGFRDPIRFIPAPPHTPPD